MSTIITPGVTHELTEVRPSEFMLDPEINRAVDEAWVAKIMRDFNPLALGLFTAWRMPDGSLMLLDGQHRKLACTAVGHDEPVAAYIYDGLTPASAADLFLQINAQRNVNPIDKFRKALAAEHPDELAVARTLDEFGLRIGHGSGEVSAPVALLSAHARIGDDTLRELCRTLISAFPEVGAASALTNDVIPPLTDVIKRYRRLEQEIDMGRLQSVLVDFSYDGLLAERDVNYKGHAQKNKRWHTAMVVVKAYNTGARGTMRLRSWGEVA